MEPFIGQIQAFGFNFAPRGWAFCNGQLLSISQYSALFSLLGTIYGGDGRTTFGLPDLRGRAMINFGHGPGLSNYAIGARGGFENRTLTVAQLPSHNHNLFANLENGTTSLPTGKVIANAGTFDNDFGDPGGSTVALNASSIGNNGGNQSFSLLQPYLAVGICIALLGIYPSRN